MNRWELNGEQISVSEAQNRMSDCQPYVLDGSSQNMKGEEIYSYFEGATPSRHLTFVFNLFMFFQIFNLINARKIDDELNVFQNIKSSRLYSFSILFMIFAQILLVQNGGKMFGLHLMGLTFEQWILCIGFASTSLIVSLVLKFIPDNCFPRLGNESEDDIRAA
jgi:magnesium-transporting ATPase (P-type)